MTQPANQIFAPAPPSSNQREVMRVEQHLRIVSILSCTSTPHTTPKNLEGSHVSPKSSQQWCAKLKGQHGKSKKNHHVCMFSLSAPQKNERKNVDSANKTKCHTKTKQSLSWGTAVENKSALCDLTDASTRFQSHFPVSVSNEII